MRFVLVGLAACSFPGSSGEPGSSPTSEVDGGATDSPDASTTPVAPACVGRASQPQDSVWELEVDDRSRAARVHVPASYDPARATPLWLNFHGYAMNAEWQAEVTGLEQAAEAFGAIVVHPEGTGVIAGWNAGACCGNPALFDTDDVGFVVALLDRLEAELCIDADRVFASGFSNGGFLSHRLGCELADRFAAIGSVSGVLGVEACAPSRPMPVLALHGTSDVQVPYEGNPLLGFSSAATSTEGWAARNGCDEAWTPTFAAGDVTCERAVGCEAGADVERCTIDGGGHQWPGGEAIALSGKVTDDLDATSALWAFFVAHPRP